MLWPPSISFLMSFMKLWTRHFEIQTFCFLLVVARVDVGVLRLWRMLTENVLDTSDKLIGRDVIGRPIHQLRTIPPLISLVIQ